MEHTSSTRERAVAVGDASCTGGGAPSVQPAQHPRWRRRAPHHTRRLMAELFVELRRISAQMQEEADHLVSLRASMPNWQSMTMGPAASPPPVPPSAGSSVTGAEPASLPPQLLDCSAAIETACQAAAWNMMGMELGKAPSSWVEAEQEFSSSAPAQISVATSGAGLSVPLTAQESSSMAPLKTRAVQNPRKKKRRDGPKKARAPWIRELGEKWRALSKEERAKQPRWPPIKTTKPALSTSVATTAPTVPTCVPTPIAAPSWSAPLAAGSASSTDTPAPAPAGNGVGAPAIVPGAAVGARAPTVVGAAASSTPAPPLVPLPAPPTAAAPLLGLAPCAATTTAPWASLPVAVAVPVPPPFPATAPGYPTPPAVDQIELACRLAVSRMTKAVPPLAGWLAQTAASTTTRL